jgi:hypothetical protein
MPGKIGQAIEHAPLFGARDGYILGIEAPILAIGVGIVPLAGRLYVGIEAPHFDIGQIPAHLAGDNPPTGEPNALILPPALPRPVSLLGPVPQPSGLDSGIGEAPRSQIVQSGGIAPELGLRAGHKSTGGGLPHVRGRSSGGTIGALGL